MDCCLVVLLFVPGGSKSKLIAEGSFAFPYVQGVSQGGLWQERTSESLSGKARGRQLPHFFQLHCKLCWKSIVADSGNGFFDYMLVRREMKVTGNLNVVSLIFQECLI